MRDDGLTLVEMLVVLAIIGVASGAAALALPGWRTPGVEGEARVLARAVQAAADSALSGDAPAVLRADPHGYRIGTAARHDLPPEMRLDFAGTASLDEGARLALKLDGARASWIVVFDGLRATAIAESPGG